MRLLDQVYTFLETSDVSQARHNWCASNARELAGARWEIYGDWHDDPALLQTEVHYLLK